MFSHAGPDIWLEYAQYSIGGMGSAGGLDKVRAIFERALTAVGLHMTKGSAVWDAYREFENVMLSTAQVCLALSSPIIHRTRPKNGTFHTNAHVKCIAALDTTFSCLLQPPAGGVPCSEEQVKLNTQLERIHTLFRRQLAVPFMGRCRLLLYIVDGLSDSRAGT